MARKTTTAQPTSLRELSASIREKAFEKVVVTIISNDKRDNNEATTAFLTCENKFFSISRIVPLGVPVEVEKCLIDSAKDTKILVHIPEVKNGRTTGNHIPSRIAKYTITEG